jgi:hypothetical protein
VIRLVIRTVFSPVIRHVFEPVVRPVIKRAIRHVLGLGEKNRHLPVPTISMEILDQKERAAKRKGGNRRQSEM